MAKQQSGITNQLDLPKLPIQSSLNGRGSDSSPHKNPNNKENIQQHKIRRFVKLFKNSQSTAQIFKISPYCNGVMKDRLIQALGATKTRQRIQDRTRREDHHKIGQHYTRRHEITTINNNQASYQEQVSRYNMASPTNRGSTQLCSGRKTSRPRIDGYIRKIVIQMKNDSIQLEVSPEMCERMRFLKTEMIISALNNKLTQQNRRVKSKAVTGFEVVDFQCLNRTAQFQQIDPRRRNPRVDRQKQSRKITQSSTYLLSIDKLDIRSDLFSSYDCVILKPIVPQRIEQFIRQASTETQASLKTIQLKDFDIIKCLGSGGFSTVFLVRGNFNNKYYAMKLVDKQFIIESERDGIVENERFILETLTKKQDPSSTKSSNGSFVTQLSFCFETVHHFVFMIEYCHGGQLFNQLKKVRKMTEDQARFYFLEILVGLDFIHSHNIVYRDLKPENLLIDSQGHIKIADFGLSKPVQNCRTQSYSFCGSPEYMAPEMLTKSGHNYLLDYYCLGALLYELVIGVPPYYSLKQEEIYNSILAEQLSFPSNVELSQEIVGLLTGLLKKDAKHRLGSLYGIKEIMCHPWIGKIKKSVIESRGLVPPFVPNLEENNFDDEEIKSNVREIMAKLKEDAENPNFETHFCDQFRFIHPQEKPNLYRIVQAKKPESFTSRKIVLTKSNSTGLLGRQKFLSPSSYRSSSKFNNNLTAELQSSVNKTNRKSPQERFKIGLKVNTAENGRRKIGKKIKRPVFSQA